MTARSRRRTAALIFGLLLAIVTQATARGQIAPTMPPPAAPPIVGAPMPNTTVMPAPAVPSDVGGTLPPPVINPGGFGSLQEFSNEVQIQDLIRANGGPGQPLSVTDYRLRTDTPAPGSSRFRLQGPMKSTDPFRLIAGRGSQPAAQPETAGSATQGLAWPAIVSNCLDAPPPGGTSACPS